MALSLQRLGDNPRDYDAAFSGFTPETAQVCTPSLLTLSHDLSLSAYLLVGQHSDAACLKPTHAHLAESLPPSSSSSSSTATSADRKPWKIYPAPPPPHWKWKGDETKHQTSSDEIFEKDQCEIPSVEAKKKRGFQLGDDGVFKVFDEEGAFSPPFSLFPSRIAFSTSEV
jgi:hypothetical protein